MRNCEAWEKRENPRNPHDFGENTNNYLLENCGALLAALRPYLDIKVGKTRIFMGFSAIFYPPGPGACPNFFLPIFREW